MNEPFHCDSLGRVFSITRLRAVSWVVQSAGAFVLVLNTRRKLFGGFTRRFCLRLATFVQIAVLGKTTLSLAFRLLLHDNQFQCHVFETVQLALLCPLVIEHWLGQPAVGPLIPMTVVFAPPQMLMHAHSGKMQTLVELEWSVFELQREVAPLGSVKANIRLPISRFSSGRLAKEPCCVAGPDAGTGVDGSEAASPKSLSGASSGASCDGLFVSEYGDADFTGAKKPLAAADAGTTLGGLTSGTGADGSEAASPKSLSGASSRASCDGRFVSEYGDADLTGADQPYCVAGADAGTTVGGPTFGTGADGSKAASPKSLSGASSRASCDGRFVSKYGDANFTGTNFGLSRALSLETPCCVAGADAETPVGGPTFGTEADGSDTASPKSLSGASCERCLSHQQAHLRDPYLKDVGYLRMEIPILLVGICLVGQAELLSPWLDQVHLIEFSVTNAGYLRVEIPTLLVQMELNLQSLDSLAPWGEKRRKALLKNELNLDLRNMNQYQQ
ncbi:hypothetical protein EJB05_43760, partial [Eragrostis curvula]